MNVHAKGTYSLQVKRGDDVVREYKKENIITNAGLNSIKDYYWAAAFKSAHAGRGTVTASFYDTILNKQWGTYSGDDSTLVPYGWIKNSVQGSTTFDPNTRIYTMNRAWSFPALTISVSNELISGGYNTSGSLEIKEVGVSAGANTYMIGPYETSTGPIFSRTVLSSSIFLQVGENLDLSYTLQLQLPTSSVVPNVVSSDAGASPAFNSQGVSGIQMVGLAKVDTDGQTSPRAGGGAAWDAGGVSNEPSVFGAGAYPGASTTKQSLFLFDNTLSPGSLNLTTIGSCNPRHMLGTAVASYLSAVYTGSATGSRYVDSYATFNAIHGSAGASNIRGFGIGDSVTNSSGPIYNYSGFVQIFNSNQYKDPSRSLKLTLRKSWSGN